MSPFDTNDGLTEGRAKRLPEAMPQFDNYRHNGALARWDKVCKWNYNPLTCGSLDYQGTVLHTLHEWPRSDPGG